ncbi:hypothetical protein AB0393_28110 [Streptomyces cyaneofuscatus]|uniref:hypothetical protein n=1 Tax=Streptomyces cyaneofuscatus TaxID=66883 RepID=UPI00344B472C
MQEKYTAAELADELSGVRHLSPEMTGSLSMLDEASLGWTTRYPQLAEAHQAFAQARGQQWPRTRTEQTWQQVVAAADTLASALRELGDVRLEHCTQPTSWGTCDRVLPENGSCRGAHEHIAAAAGPMRPGKGQVWAGDGDILEVESFDGAYAVVFSRQFRQQQLVNRDHFGRRFQLVSGPDASVQWHQIWVEPSVPVADEQDWAGAIDAALLRGGKGFVVQEDPGHGAGFARGARGFELKVFGEQVVYDETVRALASFSPPAVVVADAHHER